MLSFLHVAVRHGVVVLDYQDEATGIMRLNRDGSGQFESVTLNPHVAVADPAHIALAEEMHHEASQVCFIARSVNFPVHHLPVTVTGQQPRTSLPSP
jgi:organic hydroperoxide reductase OsmC/OhrA